jgi:hypothetical protein
MQFEEIKRVWESQNEAAVPELDVAAMEERVRASIEHEEHRATATELGLVAITGLSGLILAADAALDRGPLTSYATAVLMLGIAVYLYLGRRRRLRETQYFDDSLHGRLDRAIANLDALVARDRRFFWWFILPSAIGTLLSMLGTFHGRPLWVWLLQPIAWLLAYGVVQWGLYAHILPKRRRLERLREELVSADPE